MSVINISSISLNSANLLDYFDLLLIIQKFSYEIINNSLIDNKLPFLITILVSLTKLAT